MDAMERSMADSPPYEKPTAEEVRDNGDLIFTSAAASPPSEE